MTCRIPHLTPGYLTPYFIFPSTVCRSMLLSLQLSCRNCSLTLDGVLVVDNWESADVAGGSIQVCHARQVAPCQVLGVALASASLHVEGRSNISLVCLLACRVKVKFDQKACRLMRDHMLGSCPQYVTYPYATHAYIFHAINSMLTCTCLLMCTCSCLQHVTYAQVTYVANPILYRTCCSCDTASVQMCHPE
jgi:hypothetical protein